MEIIHINKKKKKKTQKLLSKREDNFQKIIPPKKTL